jgi:hypothetical protein
MYYQVKPMVLVTGCWQEDLLVPLVLLVQVALQAQLAQLAHKEPQAQLVPQALQEVLDHKEPQALLDHKELQELQEYRELQVQLDHKEQPEPLVHKAQLAPWEPPVYKEQLEPLVHWVPLD